jgi:hypothetical protein
MAETSWPFYGVETSETQFSKWARALAFSGVVSGLALTPGTGMQVVLGVGTALVRGPFYENDAAKNLTIGAAPATAGQTRLDAIVLRLDQAANSITAVVKAGTANTSGGALPAFTQDETTWELHIGTITVANGTAAITAGMIRQLRPSPGLRVLSYATTDRPTPTDTVALGIDTTAKELQLWLAGAWSNLFTLANMSGTLPVSQGGTGVTTAKAAREALQIYVQPSAPSHVKGRVWIPGSALV